MEIKPTKQMPATGKKIRRKTGVCDWCDRIKLIKNLDFFECSHKYCNSNTINGCNIDLRHKYFSNGYIIFLDISICFDCKIEAGRTIKIAPIIQ